MLRSEFTGDVVVFAREHNDRTFYSIGISKKDVNKEWVNGYMGASFRKGVTIPNKTKIEIKKAWLDFYINKDKQTVIGIFIYEFEYQEKPQEAPEGFQALEDDDDCPF